MTNLRCFCVIKECDVSKLWSLTNLLYFKSSEIQGTVLDLSPSTAGSETSGPQLLPVRALNEVFIGESLSSRYLEACDRKCGIQCLSISGIFI